MVRGNGMTRNLLYLVLIYFCLEFSFEHRSWFLDVSPHLYERVRRSVGSSVCRSRDGQRRLTKLARYILASQRVISISRSVSLSARRSRFCESKTFTSKLGDDRRHAIISSCRHSINIEDASLAL